MAPIEQNQNVCAWGSGGRVRYGLIVVCVAAQGATLAITWPLWQLRSVPPHLPAIDLPELPFGWLLVGSLAGMLACPRIGLRFHLVGLAASFVFDQYRIQPQVIGIAVLMIGVVEDWASELVRWFLVAMWLWSGLHKMLSPDWLGPISWDVLTSVAPQHEAWHGPFAYGVALGEIGLGLLAVARPRWAAVGCAALHLGIAALFSPWLLDRHHSVIPWNLCTAAVGAWLMWRRQSLLPRTAVAWGFAAAMLSLPAGFYVGAVPHSLAHALYSDNVPMGLITSEEGLRQIRGGEALRVPFPHTRRLLRQFFERTARPGSKLHVADPRPWVRDGYYLIQANGTAIEVTRERFRASTTHEVAGIELDDWRSIFYLSRAGARLLKRAPNAMIYAVEISPNHYQSQLLDHVRRLPNVEQLQLGGCRVTDDDLGRLAGCDNLLAIGLEETDVTDSGVRQLLKLPKLHHYELRGTSTSTSLRRALGSE